MVIFAPKDTQSKSDRLLMGDASCPVCCSRTKARSGLAGSAKSKVKHLWLRFFGEELGAVRDMAALSGGCAGSGRAPGSSQELALTKPGVTSCSRNRQS